MSDRKPEIRETDSLAYADFLCKRQGRSWKRFVDVQAPYRWNIRRLNLGRVLDVGCGNGRNLEHLRGAGIGVDHNEAFVQQCRTKGFEAYVPDEFERRAEERPFLFDTMLLSHIVEHLDVDTAIDIVRSYVRYLRPEGRLAIITPQQLGYRSDPTHVTYYDSDRHRELFDRCGATLSRHFSFPFPTALGPYFTYNETVSVGTFRRS